MILNLLSFEIRCQSSKLCGFKVELNLVLKLSKTIHILYALVDQLNSAGFLVVDIPGSERADTTAKAALCLPVTSMKLPASEFLPRVSKLCFEEWQDIWNGAANMELHSIYPVVGLSG